MCQIPLNCFDWHCSAFITFCLKHLALEWDIWSRIIWQPTRVSWCILPKDGFTLLSAAYRLDAYVVNCNHTWILSWGKLWPLAVISKWNHPIYGNDNPVRITLKISIRPEESLVFRALTVRPARNHPTIQWEFQDPKMEVLYHIRPYVVGISPYIGLT